MSNSGQLRRLYVDPLACQQCCCKYFRLLCCGIDLPVSALFDSYWHSGHNNGKDSCLLPLCSHLHRCYDTATCTKKWASWVTLKVSHGCSTVEHTPLRLRWQHPPPIHCTVQHSCDCSFHNDGRGCVHCCFCSFVDFMERWWWVTKLATPLPKSEGDILFKRCDILTRCSFKMQLLQNLTFTHLPSSFMQPSIK